jgi:diguanylate cyclase (GGDEF)-like protein
MTTEIENAHLHARIADLERKLAAAHKELATARIDPATGLPTRAYWTQMATAGYTGAAAVLLADVDQLKKVNDRYGHASGDAVLAAVAGRLQTTLPDGTVGRLGGDEFAAGTARALTFEDLNRLIAAVTAPLTLTGGTQVSVGISIGVVDLGQGRPPSLSAALSRADLAMYEAKRSDGGWCRYDADRHGVPILTDRPMRRTRHRDAA